MENTINETTTPRVVIIERPERQSNGMGVAGFVLSIVSIVVSSLPVISCVLWFLGLLFSFIGLFKRPRGLAIAGFVISLIGIVIIALCAILVWGIILAALGLPALSLLAL